MFTFVGVPAPSPIHHLKAKPLRRTTVTTTAPYSKAWHHSQVRQKQWVSECLVAKNGENLIARFNFVHWGGAWMSHGSDYHWSIQDSVHPGTWISKFQFPRFQVHQLLLSRFHWVSFKGTKIQIHLYKFSDLLTYQPHDMTSHSDPFFPEIEQFPIATFERNPGLWNNEFTKLPHISPNDLKLLDNLLCIKLWSLKYRNGIKHTGICWTKESLFWRVWEKRGWSNDHLLPFLLMMFKGDMYKMTDQHCIMQQQERCGKGIQGSIIFW